jgi:uncharacterized RDD family membrane protein YckC
MASSGDFVNDYQDYRPPEAPLTDAPAAPLELAERGARLGAKCVDGLAVLGVMLGAGIIGAIGITVVVALRGSGLDRRFGFPLAALLMGLLAFLAMVGLVIWNCIWLTRYGQTVGKRVMHIRIVRSDGSRAGLGRIFALRYLPLILMGSIPYLGLLITLADYLLIFRESRKCLHDQFADTIVVKTE